MKTRIKYANSTISPRKKWPLQPSTQKSQNLKQLFKFVLKKLPTKNGQKLERNLHQILELQKFWQRFLRESAGDTISYLRKLRK